MVKQVSRHDRAVRGYLEYRAWKEVAEILDSQPEIPIILRWIRIHIRRSPFTDARDNAALELLIQDRYPAFFALERLKGDK